MEATTKEQEAALRMATTAEITSIYHTVQHFPSYISTGLWKKMSCGHTKQHATESTRRGRDMFQAKG